MIEENNQTGLEIAVIGMSGRFPGAKSNDEFWNNLRNGVEFISFFSPQELADSRVSPGLFIDK
jgi:acyl transferase domain-containing protein